MKKTFYLMLLAAAITGSQAFAAVSTTIEGDGGYYTDYGVHEWDGNLGITGDAKNLKVTVRDGQLELSEYEVYGAYVTSDNAINNTVLMTGGEVKLLCGSAANFGQNAEVSGNKAIMTGGKVFSIEGGTNNSEGSVSLYNNQAIITGGSVGGESPSTLGHIYGGYGDLGAVANNNTVILVGKDASITVDNVKYDGSELTINADIFVGNAAGSGNALEIYGSGISLGGGIADTQNLNFHLVDGLTSNTPMLSHTGTESLDLKSVETYGFDGSAVTNWTAYDGKGITLIQADNQSIMGFSGGRDVEIKDADSKVLATAKLEFIADSGSKVLALTGIKVESPTPVPEPATGTLSLLALAGLCARRRRK